MIRRIDHFSIQTADFDAALDFYQRLLGLTLAEPPRDFKGRRLCYLQAENIRIELYSVKNDAPAPLPYADNRAGLDHVCFVVADLDRSVEKLEAAGVRIIKRPFTPLGVPCPPRIAFIEGPDRQEIELRQEVQHGVSP